MIRVACASFASPPGHILNKPTIAACRHGAAPIRWNVLARRTVGATSARSRAW